MTPTETVRPVSVEKKLFPSSSGQMFGSYFYPDRKWSFKKHDLLDARARRLFETTALGCSVDAYPFQTPLDSRSGPCVKADGYDMLMLSSYDYLGLMGDPRVDAAAIDAVKRYGTAAGGARLLTGTLDIHHKLERAIADCKGTEAALNFSSGYLANLAVLTSIFGPADRVIADTLCHRSLMDACRMSGVQVQRFEHNDPDSLRHQIKNGPAANRTLIISEGVFSMDGDVCCLPELVAIKKEFGCFLMMDDAHAVGVLGATGRGCDEHFGIDTSEIDIWTGSLAKSIPSNGGFVACSQELAIFMQHAASPYIFSAATGPASVAAAIAGFAILKQEPERVDTLRANGEFLRAGLKDMGYDTGLSETAVVPLMLEDEATTALFARRLRDYGILATPVMFPAVPQGGARLRLCVTAAHTTEQLQFALDAFASMREQ
jgi:glycine C-acetyltransferase